MRANDCSGAGKAGKGHGGRPLCERSLLQQRGQRRGHMQAWPILINFKLLEVRQAWPIFKLLEVLAQAGQF